MTRVGEGDEVLVLGLGFLVHQPGALDVAKAVFFSMEYQEWQNDLNGNQRKQLRVQRRPDV